ncbi:hypothetical protein IJJ53_02970 [Candidatus Saccharibacteria bacterium]|nr:hypothetical protein [Candidatus Saccharibacteria bacterium]
MKNPFIKYVAKEKKEDIFHSSEYGKAQSAGVVGTASTESFNERMKVEKNRQIVRGYNDSRVVTGAYTNGPRAKKYTPPEKKDGVLDKNPVNRSSGAPSAAKPAAPPVKRAFTPPIKPNFGK